MKYFILATLLAVVSAARLAESPVTKVVELVRDLKTKVEDEGQKELASYDKYACWCEETLATKASDISKGKTDIEAATLKINKLGGEVASYEVDIKQLKKDLAQNLKSQEEMKEVREKELKTYIEDKNEAEQCIGALEAAIGILAGAGAKKAKEGGKFLETLQEAQLLGTVGSLRGVLGTTLVRQKVQEKDLDMVRMFINNPEDFVKTKKSGMIALQSHQNPFGDYAPQSGQIQGILKQMYDDFNMRLEGDNVEEAKKRKSFKELMEVKVKEQEALEATLTRSEQDSAEKALELADTKDLRDLAIEQLEADEKFFAETKDACKKKAQAWSERTRLRAEQLQGMKTAIAILSSDSAKKTFENASTTFLQISATPAKAKATKAYEELRALANKFGGVALAQVAAQVRLGGHFDKVISMIDDMIRKLKYENEEDIRVRDKCEEDQEKNKQAIEDLEFDKKKVGEKLERYEDQKSELEEKIENHQKEIDASNKTITEMKDQRAKEWAEYSQAQKDDLEAIALLEEAIHSLSRFYKENNIPMGTVLMQTKPEDAPQTWENEHYSGKKAETSGVVAILEMIKEDLEKEVSLGKEMEGAGRKNFAADLKAAEESMAREMKLKADADAELAEVMRQIGFRTEDKETLDADLESENKIKEALEKQCAWVQTHFESRQQKRKLEVEGLKEAKHFLQGAVMLPK